MLGPGELKIALDVNRKTGMSMYRPPQQDLTVSLADNLVRPEMPDQVANFLQKATANPMVRRLDFASMKGMFSPVSLRLMLMFTPILDLHAFEEAVTGFRVIYDG